MLTKLKMFVFVAAMAAFLGATNVDAQKVRRIVASATPELEAAANPAYDLDQCANGKFNDPSQDAVDCSASGDWINGNLNPNNSRWTESQFVAYRARFSNLTSGTSYSVMLSYDVFHSGIHATDYLGTYDATETNANPCAGAGCNGLDENGDSTFAVPTETDEVLVPDNAAQIPGVFTMWGGTITGAVYCSDEQGTFCSNVADTYDGGVLRYIKVTFTATSSNPVLAWSGHIAFKEEHDEPTAGTEDGGIGGSPYHMAIEGLQVGGTGSFSGGRQDRSLKISPLTLPGRLRIVKDAVPFNSNIIIPNFEFYATATFGPTQFFLNDNQTQVSDLILPPNNVVEVGETNMPATWSLDPPTAASCKITGTATNYPFTYDGSGLLYKLTVAANTDVTCTFRNVQTIITAAPAYVAGRVTDAYGRGISSARLTVFNAGTGASQTVYTNTFGYYKINDLEVGEFYVMNVSHRRYSFVSGSSSFTLNSDLTGMDFVASN